jgi:DNA-binding transcriptional ArsR family regulator
MTTATAPALSGTRRAILNAIAGYIGAHGWAPTVREIGSGADVAPSTVVHHLRLLERHGLIRAGRGPRMIAVTPVGHQALTAGGRNGPRAACDVQSGQLLTSFCACGHVVGVHSRASGPDGRGIECSLCAAERSGSAEVARLRSALTNVVNVLGPEGICRCPPSSDCGLRDEATEALRGAREALAGGA